MVSKPKAPKPASVGVSAKLRAAHGWFEQLSTKAHDAAVKEKRRKLSLNGPRLSATDLIAVVDELERIQRELNPLEIRKKELVEKLAIQWAHTGIEEIEGTLGNTLLSLSSQYVIGDPSKVQDAISEGLWNKISLRRLDPALALSAADSDTDLQALLGKHAKVAKLLLAVTPPSSRRPASGQPKDEEGELDE